MIFLDTTVNTCKYISRRCLIYKLGLRLVLTTFTKRRILMNLFPRQWIRVRQNALVLSDMAIQSPKPGLLNSRSTENTNARAKILEIQRALKIKNASARLIIKRILTRHRKSPLVSETSPNLITIISMLLSNLFQVDKEEKCRLKSYLNIMSTTQCALPSPIGTATDANLITTNIVRRLPRRKSNSSSIRLGNRESMLICQK